MCGGKMAKPELKCMDDCKFQAIYYNRNPCNKCIRNSDVLKRNTRVKKMRDYYKNGYKNG